MDWLKSLFGKTPAAEVAVPDWAKHFNAQQYARFLQVVSEDLKRRGLSFNLEDGMVVLSGETDPQTRRLGLLNISQGCGQAEEAGWPALVTRHFDIVLRGSPPELDELAESFENACTVLKVRIHSTEMLDSNVPLVHRPLAENLIETLVYDLPETVASVHPDHLKKWAIPTEQAFAAGLVNLMRDIPTEVTRLDVGDGVELLVAESETFFGATKTLAMYETFGEKPPFGFLAGVPNRHMALAYPIRDIEAVRAVNVLVPLLHKLHQDGPGSISPDLYWIRDSGWMRLPSRIENQTLQFIPPAPFVDLMNQLAQESSKDVS